MDNNKNDLKYWLTIGNNPKIGSIGFKKIIDTKLSFQEIYKANRTKLKSLKLDEKVIKEIEFCQREYAPENIIKNLKKHQISAITINSPRYPRLLKEIYDPPAILYYKGVLSLSDLMIGIVGSRKPTDYGKSVTHDLAFRLASSGLTIVSGLALGIDSIAHQASLDANGKTIAVLGCGLDKIYPSSHERLAKKVIETGGAIISEYPVGTPPMKQNFPARNRIISGLSNGLIVTEAAEGSGSLITAQSALEQNREVFAIPGPIFNKNSFGPNNLIKLGAHLVTDSQDIFDELGLVAPAEVVKARKILPSGPEEEVIFEALKEGPKHINEIVKNTELSQNSVSSTITMMEIGGKIRNLGNLVYRLNN